MSFSPDNSVVWMEIPVRDIDAAVAFYNAVFDYDLKIDDSGPNPMAIFPTAEGGGVSGHIYPGNPSDRDHGPTIHLIVPDTVEAAGERCERAGGSVKPGVFPLPVGRFGYAYDPDGNSIGLFEPNQE